jgi:isopenicillin-N N-acyltransferase like protein
MIVLSLHGDHYQMGRQHGQQVYDLRPYIVEAIDARLNVLDERGAAEERAKLLNELERAWNEHARSTMAMLKGMADALELPFARLFHYAAASYVEAVLFAESCCGEGCTAWAASGPNTRGGAPILAKNRDLHFGHQPLKALAYATPQKGHRYLYATSIGSPAVYSSGINELGLTIADTHVSSKDLGPGLARYTLMMDVLEQCSTVTSAINYLQRVPRVGGGNLILADAMGDVAVFEAGYHQWGLIRPLSRARPGKRGGRHECGPLPNGRGHAQNRSGDARCGDSQARDGQTRGRCGRHLPPPFRRRGWHHLDCHLSSRQM